MNLTIARSPGVFFFLAGRRGAQGTETQIGGRTGIEKDKEMTGDLHG